jgi:hypothetical protein
MANGARLLIGDLAKVSNINNDQPQSAAAKVEGLACPKCSSRESKMAGGEYV